MRRKDFTPLIMWFCLLTAIVVLSFIRPRRAVDLWNQSAIDYDVLFIALYVFWMLIELQVTKNDVNTEGKRTADFATCQMYGVGQAFTILTALWVPPAWQGPNLAHGIGIALFLSGIGYRLWAICTLGRFYSHRVRTVAQHHIVDSGPYRLTRHPSYAGMIIANAGLVTYFYNRVTLCGYLFILVPAILLRIFVEERTLFGIEDYADFAKKRKRLFPAIW